MGFSLKKALGTVAAVVSAPVTVPLKVSGNVIEKVGSAIGAENISAPLSTLAEAGYNAIQGGQGVESVLPSVKDSIAKLGPYVSAVSSSGILGGAVTGSSLLTGLQGLPAGSLNAGSSIPIVNTDRQPAGQNAPMLVGADSDYTLPIVIGCGLLLLYLYMRR